MHGFLDELNESISRHRLRRDAFGFDATGRPVRRWAGRVEDLLRGARTLRAAGATTRR
jgi:hypothetical protein